jgi:hypothetical protein
MTNAEFVVLVMLLILISPIAAHAYVDPGSGGLLLQLLLAGGLSVGVALRAFWKSIKGRFGGGEQQQQQAQAKDPLEDADS